MDGAGGASPGAGGAGAAAGVRAVEPDSRTTAARGGLGDRGLQSARTSGPRVARRARRGHHVLCPGSPSTVRAKRTAGRVPAPLQLRATQRRARKPRGRRGAGGADAARPHRERGAGPQLSLKGAARGVADAHTVSTPDGQVFEDCRPPRQRGEGGAVADACARCASLPPFAVRGCSPRATLDTCHCCPCLACVLLRSALLRAWRGPALWGC